MTIQGLRRKIDELDRRLVALLSERAKCSLAVGRIKKREGLPLFHRKREQEIARNVARANRGPLSNYSVQHLWQEILQQTRAAVRIELRADRKRTEAADKRKARA